MPRKTSAASRGKSRAEYHAEKRIKAYHESEAQRSKEQREAEEARMKERDKKFVQPGTQRNYDAAFNWFKEYSVYHLKLVEYDPSTVFVEGGELIPVETLKDFALHVGRTRQGLFRNEITGAREKILPATVWRIVKVG